MLEVKIKRVLAAIIAVALAMPLQALAREAPRASRHHARHGHKHATPGGSSHGRRARSGVTKVSARDRRPRRKAAAGAGRRLGLTVRHARHGARGRARTAGDPATTISDFKFAPASITVHVGDTITWTNLGPSEHTATANDGSFNTGILKKGASASHTFAHAGTFSYVCTIHPFMHGTVVVLGNSSPTTSSGTGSSSSTAPSAGPSTPSSAAPPSAGAASTTPSATGSGQLAQPSGQSLPVTGLDLEGSLIVGGFLLAAGLLVRRHARRRY